MKEMAWKKVVGCAAMQEGTAPEQLVPYIMNRVACDEAEAEKQSAILRAEAEKEARIKAAEAEAEAIRQIYQAQAESIKLINEANPEDAFILLKKLEAFEKVSDGQATKIIIPSDLQGVVGLVNAVAESTKTDKK